MDRLSEGYKQAIDKILGPMKKSGFEGSEKKPLLISNHVLATTEKSCAKKKVPKNTFRPNVKTTVSP